MKRKALAVCRILSRSSPSSFLCSRPCVDECYTKFQCDAANSASQIEILQGVCRLFYKLSHAAHPDAHSRASNPVASRARCGKHSFSSSCCNVGQNHLLSATHLSDSSRPSAWQSWSNQFVPCTWWFRSGRAPCWSWPCGMSQHRFAHARGCSLGDKAIWIHRQVLHVDDLG